MDKDAVLICNDKLLRIVTLDGNPRPCKKLISQLEFDFKIESVGEFDVMFEGVPMYLFLFIRIFLPNVAVCLPDSILAFHKNGMQGRSLKNGEITQEITDLSRTYRLLGSDK